MRACVRTTDGNVVVAGYSAGTLNGTDDDDTFVDAVAVKIDSNSGDMIWIYQVRNISRPLAGFFLVAVLCVWAAIVFS